MPYTPPSPAKGIAIPDKDGSTSVHNASSNDVVRASSDVAHANHCYMHPHARMTSKDDDLANTGSDKPPENLGATLKTNVNKVPAAFYNKTGKDGIAWSKKNPQAMISSFNKTVRHLRWQQAKTDVTITDLANKINAFGLQLPSKGSNENPVPRATSDEKGLPKIDGATIARILQLKDIIERKTAADAHDLMAAGKYTGGPPAQIRHELQRS